MLGDAHTHVHTFNRDWIRIEDGRVFVFLDRDSDAVFDDFFVQVLVFGRNTDFKLVVDDDAVAASSVAAAAAAATFAEAEDIHVRPRFENRPHQQIDL